MGLRREIGGAFHDVCIVHKFRLGWVQYRMPIKKKDWTRLRVFGENVRRERRRRGLTQKELAERAKIATRNLQKVEAGEVNLRFTTADRIRLALRCPWKRLALRE